MFRLFLKQLARKNIFRLEDGWFLQPRSLKFFSNSTNQHSPTVSYLINKCGLSSDSAISASRKIHIKDTEKSNSILQLFKAYDFSQSQITDLITKSPSLILADPVKTLKPKLEFFESLGLSKPDIAKAVTLHSYVLFRSLTNQLIPTYNILKRSLHTNEDIITAFFRCSFASWAFHQEVETNITVLRTHGVPELNFRKFLVAHPRVFALKNDRFLDIVRKIEEMRFDPCSWSFVSAIGTMGAMGKSLWEKKIEAYKSFGWSEEDALSAFKLQPGCMITSEKKIQKLMDFYLNELGLQASYVAKCPNIMLISLEKRVIPRCSVLQLLLSNGLIEKDLNLIVALNMTKKRFEDKYVNPYQEKTPEILKAYQGEVGYPGLQTLRAILRLID